MTLHESKQKLSEAENSILTLEAKCEQGDERKKGLAGEVTECEAKLSRASKLLSGLGGEQHRWEEHAKALKIKYDTIVGDALLVSAFLAYLGPLPPSYRQSLLEKWKVILMSLDIGSSENFTFADALGDPLQIRLWNVMGLIDTHSIENAIFVTVTKNSLISLTLRRKARNILLLLILRCKLIDGFKIWKKDIK